MDYHIITETIVYGGQLDVKFERRENAFENKFAHDAEMQFKAGRGAASSWGFGPLNCWANLVKTRRTTPAKS